MFSQQGFRLSGRHWWSCGRSIIDRGSFGRLAAQLPRRLQLECRPGRLTLGVRASSAGPDRREGRRKYHCVRISFMCCYVIYRSLLLLESLAEGLIPIFQIISSSGSDCRTASTESFPPRCTRAWPPRSTRRRSRASTPHSARRFP